MFVACTAHAAARLKASGMADETNDSGLRGEAAWEPIRSEGDARKGKQSPNGQGPQIYH
jgi:hypothetical protein